MHKAASHFKGKDALSHVKEVKSGGLGSFSEAHGAESPGHIGAFADSMREVAFVLLLLFASFPTLHLTHLLALSCGLILWKTGRSAWLGWSRLERLHRLIEQEKYEIEHHRDQEREELIALYSNKGFEGELLENIVNHLMNDSDRLLKVMLEEEMGLNLEAFEHPLKQALGAFLGSLLSSALFLTLFYLLPQKGPFIAAALLLGGGALITAIFEKNRWINALVWTLAIGALAATSTYLLLGSIYP